MKTITCYFDFISPYAYLAFEALPLHLMGLSHRVVYKPVLFAAMLKHHGQLGPAEIAGKREWTYRQVLWLSLIHI
jgi:2-hydroxychromene-2-carboxylate isomerase